MTFVPFAPWEPDKALLGGKQAPEARGVLPSSAGYLPFPSLWEEPSLPALPEMVRGAISLHDTEGNPVTLVGTDSALYTLHARQWVNVGSGYTGISNRWDFARYGNTVIAVNGADTPQYATLEVGGISDFAPIPGAPVASSVEVVKEFVMLGGVEGTKVRWSAIGNPLDWPEPGSNDAQYKQADEQDFPDTGSAVAVSGALSGLDVVIFTERAVHRGSFTGAPYFFQFDILDKGRGAIAPCSVVTGSNAIYFLSEEGFFITNGGSVKNISLERITNWFRAVSDDTRRHEARGAIDPATGIVYWTFAGDGAAPGVHDHILVYHPQLDQWTHAQALSAGIFSGLSIPWTLEDLDELGPLDSLQVSLDSRVWKGAVPLLSAFSPENRLCRFAGPAMEATIETAETGGERVLVHGVRPLVDGAKAQASLLYRDFQHQASREAVCSPVSSFNGVAYTHVSTRYMRARVIIPAGQAWSHAVGCDALFEKEGAI
jgi:hypothetical protein